MFFCLMQEIFHVLFNFVSWYAGIPCWLVSTKAFVKKHFTGASQYYRSMEKSKVYPKKGKAFFIFNHGSQ